MFIQKIVHIKPEPPVPSYHLPLLRSVKTEEKKALVVAAAMGGFESETGVLWMFDKNWLVIWNI